ncbi:MAG TPA: hypothetical protein VMU28_11245 [Terriglobales bacterium]|nr:hypothetical protein [Terriglobales bacterium]
MGTPFSTPHVEERRSWAPMAIAAGVIVLGLVIALVLSRTQPKPTGPVPEDPYASNIKVMDVHASQAQNFAGGSVYYLEGEIANTGSKSVTGATVEAVFRNALGEVVDRQSQPLTILQQRPGYTDSVSLAQHPLTANMQDQFRLTFEHISADWNQGVPELRFIHIETQ